MPLRWRNILNAAASEVAVEAAIAVGRAMTTSTATTSTAQEETPNSAQEATSNSASSVPEATPTSGSTGQQSAVQEILQTKLKDIAMLHVDLVREMEKLDSNMDKIEQMANSEQASTQEILALALHMDNLYKNLTISLNAIKSINDDSEAELAPTSTPQTGTSQSTASKPQTLTLTGQNSDTIMDVLKVQMDVMQEEITRKLMSTMGSGGGNTSQEKKLVKKLSKRLEHVEAKMYLMQEMQLRNDRYWKQNSTKVDRLETSLVSLQNQTENLDLKIDTTSAQLAAVERDTTNLVRLNQLLNHLHMNVTSRDELCHRLHQLEEEMTKLHVAVLSSENTLSETLQGAALEQKSQPTETVSPMFSATVNMELVAKPRDKIKFERVQLNKWGGYDPSTSKFTAPAEGNYMFSVSVSTSSEGTLTLAIVKNGQHMALCSGAYRDSQVGTCVLLSLEMGDSVWVETEGQTSPAGVHVGSGFSNFVGCRMS